jgi:hypothetical protein
MQCRLRDDSCTLNLPAHWIIRLALWVVRLPDAEGVANIGLACQRRARELPAAAQGAGSEHHQLRLLPAEANAIDSHERAAFVEINPDVIQVDLNPNKGAQASHERDPQRRIFVLSMPLICADHLCFPVAYVCSSSSISKLEHLVSLTFAQ